MDWIMVYFFVAVAAGLLLIIGIGLTLWVSKRRLYSFTETSFISILGSCLWGIFYVSTLAVFMSTLKSISKFSPFSWLGLIMIVIGLVLFIWSILTLRLKETFGLEGEFCSRGPYGFCRNPQTTGLIFKFLGASVLTLSYLMTILTVIHIVFLLLAVFAEEPWLHKQYGEQYNKYKQKVPNRFVPFINFKNKNEQK